MSSITLHKRLDYIAWAILIYSIILLRFNNRMLDNIINSNNFITKAAILGALISIVIMFFLYKKHPNYFKSSKEERGSAVLSYLIGIIIITIFSSGYLDKITSEKNKEIIKGIVLKKSKNIRYGSNYLTLKIKGNIEKFQVLKSDWEKTKENDTLQLTIGKGISGFQHLLSLNINHNQSNPNNLLKSNNLIPLPIDRENGIYITFKNCDSVSEIVNYVNPNPSLTSSDIEKINKTINKLNLKTELTIVFTKNGGKKINHITQNNIGKFMVIIINKHIVLTSLINSQINSRRMKISGDISEELANTLMDGLIDKK